MHPVHKKVLNKLLLLSLDADADAVKMILTRACMHRFSVPDYYRMGASIDFQELFG